MIILSPKDILIVKRKSLIADYDKETIFNLYQPMIGALGCALYMTLLYEAKNQKITSVSTHEQILIKMQVTTQEFLKARGLLEAVGLLKTFIEGSEEEIKTYRYNLYAPKTPKSFFDNTLLYGMLIKYSSTNSSPWRTTFAYISLIFLVEYFFANLTSPL